MRSGSSRGAPGQAIDLTAAPGELDDIARIERLHAGKTGALFAASAELGAIAAGATPATCADLGRYGLAIGVAFQHADDRDDGEFLAHADAAAQRIRALGDEARAIAERLGPRAATLSAIAAWFASRA
jgi:hypothetical protein